MYVHVTTSYIRIWTLHYVLYWYCMYYIGNADTVHVYTDLLCAEVLSQVVHHRVQLGGGNEAEWEKSESLETLSNLIFFIWFLFILSNLSNFPPIWVLVKHFENLLDFPAGQNTSGHHGEEFIQLNCPIFILEILFVRS